MVGEYRVKSKSLVENKGTWYVSARVPDPATGKVKQVMRSTGVKVQYKQDGTPRKSREAQARMETICDELEKELGRRIFRVSGSTRIQSLLAETRTRPSWSAIS